MKFLAEILEIQEQVNANAIAANMPFIDLLNNEEVSRIKELIELKTFPNGWKGTEPLASEPLDIYYSDGSVMKRLI